MAGVTPEMAREYERAAGRFNAQLRNLQRAVKTGKADASILNYAYRQARIDVARAVGQKTLPRKAPMNLWEYQQRMNIIKRFYDRPTATLTGIKHVYDKRANTISEKLGFKVTSDDLRNIMETGLYDALNKSYGSSTAWKMLARIKQQKEQIKEQIEQGRKIHFTGLYGRRLDTFAQENGASLIERYINAI